MLISRGCRWAWARRSSSIRLRSGLDHQFAAQKPLASSVLSLNVTPPLKAHPTHLSVGLLDPGSSECHEGALTLFCSALRVSLSSNHSDTAASAITIPAAMARSAREGGSDLADGVSAESVCDGSSFVAVTLPFVGTSPCALVESTPFSPRRDPCRNAYTQVNSAPSKKIWAE